MKVFDRQCISFFALLSLLLFLIQLFQVDWLFEDGVYIRYTMSILKDFDFNIYNQFNDQSAKWIVSSTYNHPDFEHHAASILLFPFFLIQLIVSKIFTTISATHPKDFVSSYIIAVNFYVALGAALTYKTMQLMKLSHIKKAMFFFFCSTAFFWYYFIVSTNTNVLGFFISSLAIPFFITQTNDTKDSFLLGILAGIGYSVRIQLGWIFIYPFHRILRDGKIIWKEALLFIIGSAIPISLLLLNNWLQRGTIANPVIMYLNNSNLMFFYFHNIINSLFGANGLFVVSPIYVLICIGALIILVKSDRRTKLMLVSFLAFPLFLFNLYNSSWAIMDCLIGRHFITFSFFAIWCLSVLITETEKKSQKLYRILMGILIFSVFVFFINMWRKYYYDSTTYWERLVNELSFEFVSQQGLTALSILFPANKLSSALQLVAFAIPINLLLSFAIKKITASSQIAFCFIYIRKIAVYFALFSVSAYLIFTMLNLANNKKNVDQLQRAGGFSHSAIAVGISPMVLDDYTEMFLITSIYYYKRNNCKIVKNLFQQYLSFMDSVRSQIEFKATTTEQKFKDHRLIWETNLGGKHLYQLFLKEVMPKCHL